MDSVEIINHFFVTGMSIDRSQNPSLNDLKIVTGKHRNYLHYVDKSWNENTDTGLFHTEKDLDFLLNLKKYFQILGDDQGPMGMQGEQRELKDPTHAEIIERGRFDKLKNIRKKSESAFDMLMIQEYRMISIFRPVLLKKKSKGQAQSNISIDTTKLHDKEYL